MLGRADPITQDNQQMKLVFTAELTHALFYLHAVPAGLRFMDEHEKQIPNYNSGIPQEARVKTSLKVKCM